MAAALWVQVETGLPSSKLVDRLCVDLDIEAHEAVGYLVLLWLAVMEVGCAGDLRERSDAWIERSVGWRGERGLFAAAIRLHHLDGGVIRDWHDKYGKLEAIRAEAARIKRNQRKRLAENGDAEAEAEVVEDRPADSPVDVHRTEGWTPLTSTSSSFVRQEEQTKDRDASQGETDGSVAPKRTKKTDRPPVPDVVKEFVGEFDFGPFAPMVEGFLRSQKSVAAVMATLRMHRAGELGHELATDREIGMAVQQYAATADGRFNPKYFRGFVKDAKKATAEIARREQAAANQQDPEAAGRAASDREAVEGERLLALFKSTNPTRYAELERIAEDRVPKKLTLGREGMVRGILLTLVREEIG